MREVPLELSDSLRARLLNHVEAELPNEGCALLIGRDPTSVEEVFPVANASLSPHRFSISPSEMIRAHDRAELIGAEVVGVAHSHPAGSALPSQTDVEEAMVREWLYVIVGGEGEMRAFRLE